MMQCAIIKIEVDEMYKTLFKYIPVRTQFTDCEGEIWVKRTPQKLYGCDFKCYGCSQVGKNAFKPGYRRNTDNKQARAHFCPMDYVWIKE